MKLFVTITIFTLFLIFFITQSLAPFTDDSFWFLGLSASLNHGVGFVLFGVVHDKYPVGFPLLLHVFSFVSSDLELVGKLVSGLFGVGCVIVVYFLSLVLFEKKVALLASLLCVLFLPFVFFSSVVLSESTFIFFYLLSILFLYLFLRDNRSHWLFALVTCLCLSLLIKVSALFVLWCPIALVLIITFLKNREFRKNYGFRLLGSLGLFLLILGGWLLWRLRVFGGLSSGYVGEVVQNGVGWNWQYLWQFAWWVTLPVFLCGILGLYCYRREKFGSVIVLFFACFFVLQFLWWSFDLRYLLPSAILFMIFASKGFVQLCNFQNGQRTIVCVGLFCLLVSGLVFNFVSGFREDVVLSNRLLVVKQMGLFLNASNVRELTLVGGLATYGFYVDARNFVSINSLGNYSNAFKYILDRKVRYLVFDDVLTYQYQEFQFLNSSSKLIVKDYGEKKIVFSELKRFEAFGHVSKLFEVSTFIASNKTSK